MERRAVVTCVVEIDHSGSLMEDDLGSQWLTRDPHCSGGSKREDQSSPLHGAAYLIGNPLAT
jgi:hypothetical protein